MNKKEDVSSKDTKVRETHKISHSAQAEFQIRMIWVKVPDQSESNIR